MSLPNLLPGNRYRLCRGNGATPELFGFVCTVTTQDLDEKMEFDDSMLVDCDDPTALPQRVSTAKGQTWDISGSGKCDHKRYLVLRNDFNSITCSNWQLLIDQPAAQGGGAYVGPAFIEALKLSKSENGMTTFTFSLKGQGRINWTPALA